MVTITGRGDNPTYIYMAVFGVSILGAWNFLLFEALHPPAGNSFFPMGHILDLCFHGGSSSYESYYIGGFEDIVPLFCFCSGLGWILIFNLQNECHLIEFSSQQFSFQRVCFYSAQVMTCFGDIAMAITGDFEKYLGPVVQMLREASSTRLADGPADSD